MDRPGSLLILAVGLGLLVPGSSVSIVGADPGGASGLNTNPLDRHPVGTGFGHSDPRLAGLLRWEECWAAAIIVVHKGPPGAAFASAVPSQLGNVAVTSVCGNLGETATTWDEVRMEAGTVPGLHLSCMMAQVFGPVREHPVGLTGGGICSAQTFVAKGNGVLRSVQFFDYTLDYFLGTGPTQIDGFASPGETIAPPLDESISLNTLLRDRPLT